MEKPAHITRMEAETAELDQRIEKLDHFLHNAEVELNRTQVHLLHIQLDAMRAYRRVLVIRIEHDTAIAEIASISEELIPPMSGVPDVTSS